MEKSYFGNSYTSTYCIKIASAFIRIAQQMYCLLPMANTVLLGFYYVALKFSFELDLAHFIQTILL